MCYYVLALRGGRRHEENSFGLPTEKGGKKVVYSWYCGSLTSAAVGGDVRGHLTDYHLGILPGRKSDTRERPGLLA